MLAIGYPMYWVEMYGLHSRHGVTSPWAASLFAFFVIFIVLREWSTIVATLRDLAGWFSHLDKTTRLLGAIAGVVMVVIVASAFGAALLPPHLMQEGDALNYHYSLTRQHLILGSFDRIAWSGFDLFLMPVDFALAPYWFVTALPNKFPQFLFFAGLILVLASLARHFKKDRWAPAVLAVAFFLGSHGHGIQMGTAMLDLVNAYLFLAAIDSFFKRAHWLFIIEANFYIWSKPLMPLGVLLLVAVVILVVVVFKRFSFKTLLWDFQEVCTAADLKAGALFLRQCALGFYVTALLVAGPFAVKSMVYSGTPFYPFANGWLAHPRTPDGTVAWDSLKKVAEHIMDVRNNYGYGRSASDFIQHFWLIAVPQKGVNNLFDYPVGLTYLLVLGPFIFFTVQAFRQRQVPLLPLLTMVLWGLWWLGSQQSRWLFVPLLLMFVLTAVRLERPSKILWLTVILALVTNGASVVRSHRANFGKTPAAVLRAPDRKLVDLSVAYIRDGRSDMVEVEEYEVAFAQFPVVVRKENLPNAVAF